MGLFKKEDAVVKEIAKKEKQKKKQAKGGEAKSKLKGLRLLSWLYQPALVIVVFSVLFYAALEFVFIQRVESLQADEISTTVNAVLVRNARRFIDEREALTESLSNSPLVAQAVSDRELASRLESDIKVMYKDLDSLFIIPQQNFADLRAAFPLLTFANSDAVRRAASGEKIKMDAFLDDGRWLLQSAALIKGGEAEDVLGVVLVVHDTSILRKAFILPSSVSAGAVHLKNSVDPSAKAIVAMGGKQPSDIQGVAVPGSDWLISFHNADPSFASIDRVALIAIVAVYVVLTLIVVLVVCRVQMSRLKKDLIAATQSIKTAISGESKKTAYIHFAEVKMLSASLSKAAKDQSRQRAQEKIASATVEENQQDSEQMVKEGGDSPLFDDDLLDLDVLEGSEDPGANDFSQQEDLGGSMVEEVEQLDLAVPQSIFRAYDIRGVVDETLNEGVVELIGRAVATEALAQGQTKVCVGFDGRLSSETYCEALTKGIVSTGADAVIVGRVPTPVLYFATHHLNTGTGVMITGSHNPSNYNGFKMMIAGSTLAGDDIQKLYNRIMMQDFANGQGARSEQAVDQDYMDTILNDIAVAAPLKVVVDAGNGVAGELGPQLIEELGCEVIPLFCDIDGTFPNHHPDPGKPKNLEDLIAAVEEHDADIGLAFDGDGDRVGVVTNTGKIIWPDRLLMLFAKDVVSRNPGADIIFDVKCSRRLNGLISGYGGRPVMWKTGHSLIKAKMKESGALLAGEMSGHIFFKERWFGFDDGLYSAARLLEILGVEDRTADDVFSDFPEDVSTPEINIDVTDENKFMLVEKLCQLKGNFADGNVSTIDGLRVDYPNGWGLCRASNTTPVLVLRFEADDEAALEDIKEKFKAQLAVVDASLRLDF